MLIVRNFTVKLEQERSRQAYSNAGYVGERRSYCTIDAEILADGPEAVQEFQQIASAGVPFYVKSGYPTIGKVATIAMTEYLELEKKLIAKQNEVSELKRQLKVAEKRQLKVAEKRGGIQAGQIVGIADGVGGATLVGIALQSSGPGDSVLVEIGGGGKRIVQFESTGKASKSLPENPPKFPAKGKVSKILGESGWVEVAVNDWACIAKAQREYGYGTSRANPGPSMTFGLGDEVELIQMPDASFYARPWPGEYGKLPKTTGKVPPKKAEKFRSIEFEEGEDE